MPNHLAASKVEHNPPLTEQRRIVARMEQLMALGGALETQLAAPPHRREPLLRPRRRTHRPMTQVFNMGALIDV